MPKPFSTQNVLVRKENKSVKEEKQVEKKEEKR